MLSVQTRRRIRTLFFVALVVPAIVRTQAQPPPRVASAAAFEESQAQAGDALKREVDSTVVAYMKAAEVTGVSVAVIAPGPSGALITRTFNYGSTVRMGGKPVTSATIFEIGSVTKVFTAALLATFVGEGRVALGDPLQNYLPAGVRAPGTVEAPITLLDLATHRSALPRMPTNIGTGPSGRARYAAEDLYEFLNQYALPRMPGAAFEYSNLGFGLLGTVLARLADRDFETLVVERIATPLRMPDTRLRLNAEQRSRLATGYTRTGAAAPEWNNTGAIAGGGGLHSSADDVARFLAAFIDPPRSALGAALEDTQRLHPYAQQPQRVTGLGWGYRGRTPDFPHEMLMKNGGTAGFSSWTGIIREKRVGLVLLANGPGIGADGGPGPSLLRFLGGLVLDRGFTP